MRNKKPVSLLIGLAGAVPAIALAFDLTFLDQAPIRFMSDAEIDMMEATVVETLDKAADGETLTWRNDDTGNSGSVTAVKSFSERDLSCRRIEIVNRDAKAAFGGATSMFDMCQIDGSWKILRQRP
jgi:surface antigen